MFSGLMLNAWVAATILAVVSGLIGFFIVARGSSFVAHAVPQGAFAGAAGASLLGVSTVAGLGVFAVLGALGIGWLGRRGRHDVATALTLVVMLGVGSLFLSWSQEYEPEIFSLLFGEVLGISRAELLPIAGFGVASVAALAFLYRPLLVASVVPEMGEARGIGSYRIELCFLVVVAFATSMAVPVVGTLLVFSLLIGPPAAARSFASRPWVAMALGVGIALATVWVAIVASYESTWPIGFFVGAFGAGSYALGRGWAHWRRTRRTPRSMAVTVS
jgi:zinc/manganese transport system permease protein